VGECTLVGGSRSKVFSSHEGKIRAWGAEGNTIALVVRPHTNEGVASCNLALEMEYT